MTFYFNSVTFIVFNSFRKSFQENGKIRRNRKGLRYVFHLLRCLENSELVFFQKLGRLGTFEAQSEVQIVISSEHQTLNRILRATHAFFPVMDVFLMFPFGLLSILC